MRRRDLLTALPLAAGSAVLAAPAFAQTLARGPAKVIEIRQHKIRLIKDMGRVPGSTIGNGRIGGNEVLEIVTDQGISGIAPGADPATLAFVRTYLIGKNSFSIGAHVAALEARNRGGVERGGASVEIALWDITGKALGQPLNQIWGGAKDRLPVYCSFASRGASIEERTDVARRIKDQGFRAVKLRPHWVTMKEDVRLVESVRKVVGDDFLILTDANQADPTNVLNRPVWDHSRAIETAAAFQAMGVGWLEEPLERFDLDGLSELNRLFSMDIAGGENNAALSEFRDYIQHDCYNVLQPELQLVGPTRALKIAALAKTFSRKIVPHEGFQSLATIAQLHFAAGVGSPIGELIHDPPNGDYTNYFFPYDGAPSVGKDGVMILPSAPGLGVALKRDLIES